MFGKSRREIRADEAITEAVSGGSQVCTACWVTLSAYWTLSMQVRVSPLVCLLLLLIVETRGNGPFCTVYRSKVKAAISPLEIY